MSRQSARPNVLNDLKPTFAEAHADWTIRPGRAEDLSRRLSEGGQAPYGLCDDSRDPGELPPHVVRDVRDLQARSLGALIFRSDDLEEAYRVFDETTQRHLAEAVRPCLRGESAAPVL